MLLLGILSWLQIVFLPGFILINALDLRTNLLKSALLIFGASLTLNYIIVFILTVLHCYTKAAVIGSWGLEAALALRYLPYRGLFKRSKGMRPHLDLTFSYASIFASTAIIYLIFYLIFKDPYPKTIFSLWDAVVSWGPWAVAWSQNNLPQHTFDYPQLIPANVSLTFQWIGSRDVQLFGKLLFYFFPFVMVGCLWDLAKKENAPGYFWGIVFLVFLLIKLFGDQMASGMVDVPVACMGLLPIYILLSFDPLQDTRLLPKWILLGSLLSFGVAATKQAGLLTALMYPILLYLLVLKQSTQLTELKKWVWVFRSYFVLFVCLAPWYIYKVIQFHQGRDYSNTQVLLQGEGYAQLVHPTLINKFQFGMHLLYHAINKEMIRGLIPILLMISLIKAPKVRIIILLLVNPMFLFWAFYFSYDIRNLAYILPFLSIALGFGLQNIITLIGSFRPLLFLNARPHLLMTLSLALVLMGILNGLHKKYSAQYLMKQQIELSKNISLSDINKTIYDYFDTHPLKGAILSNYLILCYLPGFTEHCIGSSRAFIDVKELTNDITQYKINYLLMLKLNFKNDKIKTTDVQDYIQHHKNIFEPITNQYNFILYQIKRTA